MEFIDTIENRRLLEVVIMEEMKLRGIKVPKLKNSRLRPKEIFCQHDHGFEKLPLFGVRLELLPSVEAPTGGKVPRFMHDAFSILEEHLKTEGLFRRSGSLLRQKEVKIELDSCQVSLLSLKDHLQPIETACLIKHFFRELPEPLFTTRLQGLFLATLSLPSSYVLEALLHLCLLLPRSHLYALRYLAFQLDKVSSQSTDNLMTAGNLAVCVAPNLFKLCNDLSEGNHNGIKIAQMQVEILTLLIENWNLVGMVKDDLLIKVSSLEASFSYHEPFRPTEQPQAASDALFGSRSEPVTLLACERLTPGSGEVQPSIPVRSSTATAEEAQKLKTREDHVAAFSVNKIKAILQNKSLMPSLFRAVMPVSPARYDGDHAFGANQNATSSSTAGSSSPDAADREKGGGKRTKTMMRRSWDSLVRRLSGSREPKERKQLQQMAGKLRSQSSCRSSHATSSHESHQPLVDVPGQCHHEASKPTNYSTNANTVVVDTDVELVQSTDVVVSTNLSSFPSEKTNSVVEIKPKQDSGPRRTTLADSSVNNKPADKKRASRRRVERSSVGADVTESSVREFFRSGESEAELSECSMAMLNTNHMGSCCDDNEDENSDDDDDNDYVNGNEKSSTVKNQNAVWSLGFSNEGYDPSGDDDFHEATVNGVPPVANSAIDDADPSGPEKKYSSCPSIAYKYVNRPAAPPNRSGLDGDAGARGLQSKPRCPVTSPCYGPEMVDEDQTDRGDPGRQEGLYKKTNPCSFERNDMPLRNGNVAVSSSMRGREGECCLRGESEIRRNPLKALKSSQRVFVVGQKSPEGDGVKSASGRDLSVCAGSRLNKDVVQLVRSAVEERLARNLTRKGSFDSGNITPLSSFKNRCSVASRRNMHHSSASIARRSRLDCLGSSLTDLTSRVMNPGLKSGKVIGRGTVRLRTDDENDTVLIRRDVYGNQKDDKSQNGRLKRVLSFRRSERKKEIIVGVRNDESLSKHRSFHSLRGGLSSEEEIFGNFRDSVGSGERVKEVKKVQIRARIPDRVNHKCYQGDKTKEDFCTGLSVLQGSHTFPDSTTLISRHGSNLIYKRYQVPGEAVPLVAIQEIKPSCSKTADSSGFLNLCLRTQENKITTSAAPRIKPMLLTNCDVNILKLRKGPNLKRSNECKVKPTMPC